MRTKRAIHIYNVYERCGLIPRISLHAHAFSEYEKIMKNRIDPKVSFYLLGNINGCVRLLSKPHTVAKIPASACSKFYIREKINLHPYVSLRASVCGEIYIREKIFARPYVRKNGKNKLLYSS